MMDAHGLPMVPGWYVHREGNLLVARRSHGLTAYMRHWGALDQVHATTPAELVVLCDAQTRLGERLATAQWESANADVEMAADGAAAREAAAPVRRGQSGAAAKT